MVNFSECKFKSTAFVESNLNQAYFYNSKPQRSVAFQSCKLEEANFQDAPLKGIDLSTSEFESLTAGLFELKGAIISPIQAANIMEGLGVKVKF